MNWLMPIEATSPQPNARANNMTDLVRMNLSPGLPERDASKRLLAAIPAARGRSGPFYRFI